MGIVKQTGAWRQEGRNLWRRPSVKEGSHAVRGQSRAIPDWPHKKLLHAPNNVGRYLAFEFLDFNEVVNDVFSFIRHWILPYGAQMLRDWRDYVLQTILGATLLSSSWISMRSLTTSSLFSVMRFSFIEIELVLGWERFRRRTLLQNNPLSKKIFGLQK